MNWFHEDAIPGLLQPTPRFWAYILNQATVDNKVKYYYRFGEGFKELDSNTDPRTIVSGKDLENLLSRKFEEIIDIKNFRFISKEIIKESLGNKNIKS